MSNYKTPQEEFWAGEFGKDYIGRNQGDRLLASNLDFFVKALSQTGKFNSCLEFGSNIGMNLKALRLLYPDVNLAGVEINPEAAKILGISRAKLRYRLEQLDIDATSRNYKALKNEQ